MNLPDGREALFQSGGTTMEGIPGSPQPAGLVERAKAILLKPKEEWPRIAAEPGTPGDIVTRYALPLIAIGPVASFLGGQLFGYGAFGFSYRPGIVGALTGAIVQIVMTVVMLVVVTFIADFLAPKFGGESNRRQAFKWVAFGATAAWVGGIFGLIPSLGILGLLASLYTLYLLYLGATPVMKVPADKSLAYTAVTVVCAIVATIVASAVAAAVTGAFVGGTRSFDNASGDGGTLTIPGVGSIDTTRMEEAADRMERMASGEIKALTPAQISPLLPASIGSYTRVATSSSAVGGMGSRAEATYESGDRRFDLSVSDMAALGGLAGIASAMGVEHSEEDANGYERVYRNGETMVTEKWRNDSSRGSYGVIVADRFMIEAEGDAANIDELKAAVASIDAGDLEDLAG